MSNTIKFRRGLESGLSLITLADGEAGWCTNSRKLYVGQGGQNRLVGETSFLKLTGGTLTGALTLSGLPTSPLHAASKSYVDSMANGISVLGSVKCVSLENIPGTFSDGEIACTATGVITVDGVPLNIVDMRVLIAGQTDSVHNGIYTVKTVGEEEVNCVLVRSEEFSQGVVVSGTFVFVEEGTVYANTGWVLTGEAPITINDSMITFVQFSGAGASSFVSLADTPSTYEGCGGKVAAVNLDETGIEFKDSSDFGRTTFIALDDTPAAYLRNRLVVTETDSIVFRAPNLFDGFFKDAPATLGTTKQMLAVNSSRTAIEFVYPTNSPTEEGLEALASGWGWRHEQTSTGIHGAASGKELLNEDSVIDGGSF